MILANKLCVGDGIGIFSPSSPITATAPKRFQRAKQFLRNKGFNIIEGNLTGKQDFYRSGTIDQRVEELNDLIRNPEVKCIMSTIGGMNSNSLLPYIDYEQLCKTPKIMIGYSDMTAILLGIYSMTGLVTYYGPAMVATFGELSPYQELAYEYFSDILMEGQKAPHRLKPPPFWTEEYLPWEEQDRSKQQNANHLITVNKGVAQGRLIGGNLNTMQGIWGSPYMPKIQDGDILFVEDSIVGIETIERSFSLLKISGIFDKLSGMILGKHELYKDAGSGRKPYEVLMEVIGSADFPILAEFDCSHTHPMLTLPLGCEIQLDATKQKVSLISNWISNETFSRV